MRHSVAPAAGVLLVGLAGCFDSELNRSGAAFRNKPVETPATTPATVATAARVDQIGGQLVAQNPFLGVDGVIFQTVGRREPEIYHPDAHAVFVTEGLVDRCQSDAEVAAVLATELAKMAAEQRATDRLRKPEPMRPVVDSGSGTPGATGPDQNQLGMQALFDQKTGRSGKRKPDPDPAVAAADVLQAAGFDRAAAAAVAPLLREAAKNRGLADQFGGRGSTPQWSY